MTRPKKAPRKRLSAEEARERILEAAVEHLRKSGPESLKLSTLARELGISHQAILHHFGSREGLVAQVLHRALEALERELASGLSSMADPHEGAGAIVGRAFEALVDHGHGRLLAWLALGEAKELHDGRKPLEMLAQITHAMRTREQPNASYRDTLFTVMLSAYMTLAASVFEDGTLRAAGLDGDPSARSEFRAWLANVLLEHLDGNGG